MVKFINGIMINSSNATKLAEFYREKVGLKQVGEYEIGENQEAGFEFELNSGPGFFIADHSEVKGTNPMGQRIIINLEVEDFEKEVEELDSKGAKMIGMAHHVENYGYVATFEDPDGNYFQLVKTRE